jgi:hypothetical protein
MARSPRYPIAALCVLIAAGCSPEDAGGDFDVEVVVSDVVPTVATVAFDPGVTPDSARVRFGPVADLVHEAPVDLSSGPPYEVVMLGNKPSSEIEFEVVVEAGGDELSSGGATFTTGPVPTSLPGVTVEAADPDTAAGGFFVTSLVAAPPSAVILDADGDYVWWWIADREDAEVSRASLSADGSAVQYLTYALGGDDQELVRVSLDGAEVQRLAMDGAHHDFLELPDGTIAALVVDPREFDGETVEGDLIREYHPDGTTVDVYSVWDDVEYRPMEDVVPGPGYTHANAIDFDADDDAYTFSLYGLDSLFRVDRDTGELLWKLGGDDSDFTDDQGESAFYFRQHQFELLDDGVLVFDNGSPERSASMALEHSLDGDQAELVWTYAPDPALFCYSLGDVRRLPSGHTLVVFSVKGQVEEVTPGGELVWQLTLGMGGALGYMTWLDSLYEP